ncbi:DUF4167 domain-containing protein [Pelagibacteraceae bacterium]|nr:DUF4167 domain-containing protein [Pelagibacteraceae bacterium]|tara:strand:+ start:204 stop:572 length:369 start_codon:yes stop_codon:yes gene_type:complete
MNDTKRRTFRPRNSRSGFRPRNNNGQNSNGHFKSNGNGNMGRNNGSMTNPFNVEKTAQKYQQLAKDAHTSGDPVLYENYLQHAEHFIRRLSELNAKPKEQVAESSSLSKPTEGSTIEKKELV